MARACAGHGVRLPFRLAAPSFVLPAGVAENCEFLAGRFPEVGLALFQTEACLAYGEADLPARLAALPLAFHAHLPLDLPWRSGPAAGFAAIQGLAGKVAFLSPWCFVLHPPPEAAWLAEIAQGVRSLGLDPARILIENVPGNDLTEAWPAILESGCGVCLDLGHVLACGQERLLGLPGLWERVMMLHVYAPAGDASEPRHESLARLGGPARALLARMLDRLAPGRTVVLEVFGREALSESLQAIVSLRAEQGRTA